MVDLKCIGYSICESLSRSGMLFLSNVSLLTRTVYFRSVKSQRVTCVGVKISIQTSFWTFCSLSKSKECITDSFHPASLIELTKDFRLCHRIKPGYKSGLQRALF